jgi:HNH endonuclease
VGVEGKSYKVHRVLKVLALGVDLLPGEIVDHINRNTLDNRASNLRVTTVSGNNQNRDKYKQQRGIECSSTYVGVSKAYDKYKASIFIDNKSHHLGYFVSEHHAAQAYNEALLTYDNHHTPNIILAENLVSYSQTAALKRMLTSRL